MKSAEAKLPERFQAATQSLAENLLAAEPFVRYSQAQTLLKMDDQARNLIEQLNLVQAEIRRGQMNNQVSQQDIDRLRKLQNEVQQNQIIMDYAHTQQKAVNYLREINQEISQLLGTDFASLARQTSC